MEARYTKNKTLPLVRANLRVEKIRLLMRIAFEHRFLSGDKYEHSAKNLGHIGRMLGGWMKQQKISSLPGGAQP